MVIKKATAAMHQRAVLSRAIVASRGHTIKSQRIAPLYSEA